jgi:hypothetical protein
MSNIVFKGQEYLVMIGLIFIAVGLIKDNMLFNSLFYYIKQTVKSNKALVVILSAIGGILPISGRVTVSAGMLDTIAPKKGENGRENYGIIDYLSTHHYYMWSPLEKTVLIPMAAFSLTWLGLLNILWPLLAVSILLIFGYIYFYIKDSDVVVTPILEFNFKLSEIIRNVVPMVAAILAVINGLNPIWSFGLLVFYYCFLTKTWDYKKLVSYINWEVIIIVGLIIIFGNYVKTYDSFITDYIKQSVFDITTLNGLILVSFIAFTSAFILGSSSKFAALAVILTQLFGIEYFLWFFALEFAGYLLSPAHKCVAIGKTYFNTPLVKYITVLGIWALLIIFTAGVVVFVF